MVASLNPMRYSFIIPLYNRPEELKELLGSLVCQSVQDYEVIIVEDGSTISSEAIVESYREAFGERLRYIVTPNGGPSKARNRGAREAQGEYLLILDSDVVLPAGYLRAVDDFLSIRLVDAFGGPDAAAPDFSVVQKAINYAMTSPLTTGGIRGGSASALEQFKPRSFNLGCRRSVYENLGGFDEGMRFGEDIDFSTRIFENGYKALLFPTAWVWHKRRTDLKKFFKQVHNSGIARINLTKRHPGTLKLVHLLPMVFTLGVGFLLLLVLVGLLLMASGVLVCPSTDCPVAASFNNCSFLGEYLIFIGVLPLVLYSLIICVDSTLQNKSLGVGLRSIAAAFVQLTGYGSGFIRAWWQRCVLGRGEFEAFKKNFYK